MNFIHKILDILTHKADISEGGQRLAGWQNILVTILSVAMAWFHTYYMTIGYTSTVVLRSGHLLFAMVLAFMIYPFSQKQSTRSTASWPSIFLAILSLLPGLYIIYTYDTLVWRLGEMNIFDLSLGIIMVILLIEMTRRTMGWSMPLVAIGSIIYAFVGPWLPGLLAHQGESLSRTISQLYCTLEGIYGIPTGVMVSYVYLFILYGAFLQVTGAGKFFTDFAFAITKNSIGGPAKAAVVSSGFMAMINGSAQANVVTTGTFTIPLMKKIGYPPHIAAAVETAASSGGIFTPPVMGAGAFIMAEWIGVPYFTIIKAAALPAALFYFSVYLFVHTQAVKLGLKPIKSEISMSFNKILKEGFPLILSVFLLVALIVAGYSPQYSVISSMAALIVLSIILKEPRMSLSDFIDACVLGAKNTLMASAACASAGIAVGIFGLTGLGLRFSNMVLSVSEGSILIVLILLVIASTILGMGLPTTPTYITLAVLGAPALMKVGLSPLVAHMILFWFSQDAGVTPPVAITAYTAAAVAKSDPFKTAIAGWALSKSLYIVPIFMAYTRLVEGSLSEMFFSALLCAASLVAFNGVIHGYLYKEVNIFERIIFGISAISFMIPDRRTWIIGASLLAVGLILQKKAHRSKKT
jgi:TRAP transporter 4TM/12TM fusion protein